MRVATKVEEEEHRWAEAQLFDPEVACIVRLHPGMLEHNRTVFLRRGLLQHEFLCHATLAALA
jgi:hypothetical protein